MVGVFGAGIDSSCSHHVSCQCRLCFFPAGACAQKEANGMDQPFLDFECGSLCIYDFELWRPSGWMGILDFFVSGLVLYFYPLFHRFVKKEIISLSFSLSLSVSLPPPFPSSPRSRSRTASFTSAFATSRYGSHHLHHVHNTRNGHLIKLTSIGVLFGSTIKYASFLFDTKLGENEKPQEE